MNAPVAADIPSYKDRPGKSTLLFLPLLLDIAVRVFLELSEVDHHGRPGLMDVSKPGYRPTQADAQAFMQELAMALQHM